MNYIKFRYYILWFLALFLPACTSAKRVVISEPVTIQAKETCIASFDNFAFSTPDIDGPTQSVILPGAPWQEEISLPEEAKANDYRIAALRSVSGSTEVWIQPYKPSAIYSEEEAISHHYWVYETDSKLWHKVPSQIEGTTVFVDQIFVSSDGTLWGRNAGDKTRGLSGYPVLSRFNNVQRRFVFEKSTLQIPNGFMDAKNGDNQFPVWDTIILDLNNTFWLFAYKDAIYSYDPKNQEVIRHASLSKLGIIRQIALAPDRSIYIKNLDEKTEGYYLQEGQIFQYFPNTEEIKSIQLPKKPWPATGSILADRSGRLWFGVFGWTEKSGEWKLLHPEIDEFISVNKNLALWRYYQPPTIFLESSDGRLWFSIPRSEEWKTLRSGIAWYDPKTNQGCWFTTEGFNVGEDTKKTIWLTAGGKLYRYPLPH